MIEELWKGRGKNLLNPKSSYLSRECCLTFLHELKLDLSENLLLPFVFNFLSCELRLVEDEKRMRRRERRKQTEWVYGFPWGGSCCLNRERERERLIYLYGSLWLPLVPSRRSIITEKVIAHLRRKVLKKSGNNSWRNGSGMELIGKNPFKQIR